MQTKKHVILALMIGGILAVCLSSVIQGDIIPGQAVMKMTQYGKPDDVLHGHGARVRDSIPGSKIYLIEIENVDDIEMVLDELQTDSQVVFAEPNYTVELPESFQMSISFPDDDAPTLQDGEEPSDFFGQPSIYTVGVDQAKEIATGQGVTVAIIDNGVDFTHPFLSTRLLSTGWDFIGEDDDASHEMGMVTSHGTFVTGLVALMAPDCRILPIRAFDGDGNGNTYAIADAIYYSVGQGVDVINMSFGTVESSNILVQACNQAIMHGISLVSASGNNSLEVTTYPAAIPGVIAVSGIGADDYLASFSNYGDYVDVCAPAVNLYSTLAGEYEWGTWSGTSFAAPFVTAACILVKQINPDYSTFIMRDHIRQTATTDLQWGVVVPPDPEYGYGRINIYNSVNLTEQALVAEFGDLDGNGRVNVGDVVRLIKIMRAGGPPPTVSGNPDMNCDGIIDEFDVEYLGNRVFRSGPLCGQCD